MTTTRQYYESLIDSFAELNSVKYSEVSKFLEVKRNLNNIIQRIIKFNLFSLTFTTDFETILNKETIDDFLKEKLILSSELHYELHECLGTARLRYGGELLQYLNKLKLALLNLSYIELNEFGKIFKSSEYTFKPEKDIFKSEADVSEKIKITKKTLTSINIKKEAVRLKKADYHKVETQLKQDISSYRSYIFDNYPSICNSFPFYNKKIEVYITEAMPKNIFELRLHSYETTNGDTQLNLNHKYYDFYPAYFDNLEEITDPLFSAIVIGLNKETLTYENPFSIKSIHNELVNLFVSNSNTSIIEDFSSFLLKCDGYRILDSSEKNQTFFDIEARKDNNNYLFEIFHLQPRSIDKVIEKINELEEVKAKYKITFIFTTHPGRQITNLLEENEISTVYLFDLTRKYFLLDNSNVIHWFVKSKLYEIGTIKNSGDRNFIGDSLIKRLEKCEVGEKDWSNYEKIGIEIFKFLFEDNFKKYLAEEQVENDLKNHRRDLLVNNNYIDSTSFWADVKTRYNASAIIVDFKNYSNKLNSTTLFSVTKYIKKKVGNFAIVFSRKGIDETAIIEQKSLFNDEKLVLYFSDEELIEMIREKMIGKDPIDRLESKKFELIKRN
jgi:hypothetical protein